MVRKHATAKVISFNQQNGNGLSPATSFTSLFRSLDRLKTNFQRLIDMSDGIWQQAAD
jgi:hypothetical protein